MIIYGYWSRAETKQLQNIEIVFTRKIYYIFKLGRLTRVLFSLFWIL